MNVLLNGVGLGVIACVVACDSVEPAEGVDEDIAKFTLQASELMVAADVCRFSPANNLLLWSTPDRLGSSCNLNSYLKLNDLCAMLPGQTNFDDKLDSIFREFVRERMLANDIDGWSPLNLPQAYLPSGVGSQLASYSMRTRSDKPLTLGIRTSASGPDVFIGSVKVYVVQGEPLLVFSTAHYEFGTLKQATRDFVNPQYDCIDEGHTLEQMTAVHLKHREALAPLVLWLKREVEARCEFLTH